VVLGQKKKRKKKERDDFDINPILMPKNPKTQTIYLFNNPKTYENIFARKSSLQEREKEG
jgi:hypothetical protein